ncbi:MAG TPA: tetratricopeptide repeat protein [Verrucomicrobiae bacterium]
MADPAPQPNPAPAPKRKYVRAVGPKLRILLYVIFGFVAILGANSAYLASITVLEEVTGHLYQNYFYQMMFLAHLVLGLLLLLPVIIFGIIHMKNSWNRPNKRAVRVGYALFGASLVLLFSGVVLMRVEGFEVKDPAVRSVSYWAHVITPLLVVWLYILHRLAGPKIKWKIGLSWAGAVGAVVLGMVLLHSQDPRKWKDVVGPKEGTKYFEPSLARTATGNFIPAKSLMMDDYCMKCHQDAYDGWFHSAHHFSSFNNKPYLFSVRETRKVALERDGTVKAARWCAGCHDVVPFFSGAFDNPNFDDVNDPTAHAGITCTACHSITDVTSTKGNADYTIEEPIHYPFAFSTNKLLQFVNNQLVKAKPEFHKKTFLKPGVHKTAEFCSTCHKVNLPRELNHYKDWLRGQNSYDTYLLSGVSGHNARAFYYPTKAQLNCNGCHMPLQESKDFGAQRFGTNNNLTIHNHLFPSANTGIAHLRGEPEIVKAHQKFLTNNLRIDIFGVKEGGTIDAPLIGPLRPQVPALKRGQKYLVEVVLRTLTLGHPFTQGTADSNEIWVDGKVTSGGKVIGRTGGLGDYNAVDPWSHFVNVYMLDRHGNRIDRRNPQDIFTPLYNRQIPPGAAQIVHFEMTVPHEASAPIDVEMKLQYRKFDTTYMKYVMGKDYTNDLPITTVCVDKLTFPVEGGIAATATNAPSKIDVWQRWNDYGIALFLEGNEGKEKGELIQAEEAFTNVEKLGRADGPLNLARVYVKEGRLNDAVAALDRAMKANPPAPPWTVAWLTGVVNKQNGFLDEAIKNFRSVLEDKFPTAIEREFDFSIDYEVINELGQTYFERSKMERADKLKQKEFLYLALARFNRTLELDSENLTAHYNLALILSQLGDSDKAAFHRKEHEKYRPDDNARDHAIATHRAKNPAADHAAQSIVIYNLQRPGAFELETKPVQASAVQSGNGAKGL